MNLKQLVQDHKTLFAVFGGNILLSLHFYLVVYINSSLLNHYFSDGQLSTLYIIGSIANLILLFFAAKLMKRFGMYHFLLFSAFIEMFAVLGLAFIPGMFWVGLFFVIHQTVVVMVLLGLDVFLEAITIVEGKTGGIRSLYLTVTNAMLVISPAIVGLLVIGDQYAPVYIVSAFLMIPLILCIIGGLHKVVTPVPDHVDLTNSFKEVWANKNIRSVSIGYLILQIFFAWMIVYTPLYLHEYIGFDWPTLGVLFTIMLLPFVIFEIPIEKLADERFGEKEFMILGFAIMTLCTFLFPLITEPSFILWATVLFLSRVGASFVEVTTESYFFKQVSGKDGNIISLFRSGRPLGYIIASGAMSILLLTLPYRLTFLVLAAIVFIGIPISRMLCDTK